MTDIAAAPAAKLDTAETAAARRLRRRYAAERRFKAYGIAAVAIAGAFIVILLSDVIYKSLAAFTQTRVALEVTVARDVVDPQGTGKPDVIAAADYNALIRDALREQFPAVSSRTERRQLAGLLSTGAADELRSMVMADPGLIGQTVKVGALLSDDADLYFKGRITETEMHSGRGNAVPTGTEGEITVFSSSNDFADALLFAKQALAVQAGDLRFEASRVEDNARNSTGKEKQTLEAKIAELRARAEELGKRHNSAGDPEAVDGNLPSTLIHINGGVVKATEIANDRIKGTVMVPLSDTAEAKPGQWRIQTIAVPESGRQVADQEAVWLGALAERGKIESNFNWAFFTRGDSREPELAGVLGGLMGSLLTMAVTFVLCLPVGVLAAIYLEEFAPKNRVTELIEVNINNLAAVPSIVFGLLGLAVFLNFFAMPRSAPVVGGLVIALMSLPTIIIAARAAVRAVPPSIREAALGVGASHQQAVFHHVLPLAMPGIMTGTIIAMANALGETAPLIMIGMVAFVVDIPTSFTEAASVLPVQIFSWADLPEVAFQAKTAAAILVLLVFLFLMNAMAILLRRRFERRW
jgi:phosphate transport system permease protein